MLTVLRLLGIICIASNVIYAFPTFAESEEPFAAEDKRVMIPMPKWPNIQVLKTLDPNLVTMQKRLMVPMPKFQLPDMSKLGLQQYVGNERRKRLMIPMGRMPALPDLGQFKILNQRSVDY